MDNFLLVTFSLDRKYDNLVQTEIYNYENIGFEVDDPVEKQQLLDELPDWEISDIKIEDDSRIKYGVYFEDSKIGRSEQERFVEYFQDEIEDFKYNFKLIDNSNWEEEWKKSYTSFNIGEKIFIKPSWEDMPDTDRLVIEIDPKMAFGTGTHETTSLCMEYVEDENFSGKRILDIGCGSGILSILAKKLGADQVDACDIDEIAVNSATENASINKVEINSFKSDLFEKVSGKYDLIFANILAEIIVIMLEDVENYLKDDGILVLSGIVKEREELVKDKLEQKQFQVVDILYKNDWVLISARRRDA